MAAAQAVVCLGPGYGGLFFCVGIYNIKSKRSSSFPERFVVLAGKTDEVSQ